ncbi:winged helix-turn-helix domain-containing protein [Micromonospora sp. CPCC 206060]|uniref:winged helix-turn-helix domain-containing protein n=1 Tax=Micromonospora sp. CPCC 206060 TaxID=3122406 RepID=UPI003FA54682
MYRGRTEIVLTRRECDLLLCLAEHPRQVFTRLQPLNRVWGSPARVPAGSASTSGGFAPRSARKCRY